MGENRQGTSKISKQDHFPETTMRKIKHNGLKSGEGGAAAVLSEAQKGPLQEGETQMTERVQSKGKRPEAGRHLA